MRSVDTEKGLHGATEIITRSPSWRRAATASVEARMASIDSTTESGGSPPALSPRSIEPRQSCRRTPTARAAPAIASKTRVVAVGHDVVVVRHRRRPGKGELAEPDEGRRRGVLDRDPPPDGVEGLQPGEEVAGRRPSPGQPLVEVVVAVDEPGGDEVTVAGEHPVAGTGVDRADGGDAAPLDGDVAGRPARPAGPSAAPRPVVSPSPVRIRPAPLGGVGGDSGQSVTTHAPDAGARGAGADRLPVRPRGAPARRGRRRRNQRYKSTSDGVHFPQPACA